MMAIIIKYNFTMKMTQKVVTCTCTSSSTEMVVWAFCPSHLAQNEVCGVRGGGRRSTLSDGRSARLPSTLS